MLLGSMVSVLAAGAYATVAWVLGRRHVSASARTAHQAFIVWWAGLAMLVVFGLLREHVLADLGGLGAHLTTLYVTLGVLFVSLACLLFYLVYIHTARPALTWLPFVYYGLLGLATLWLVHGFGGPCMAPADGCVPPSGWDAGDPPALGSEEDRPGWIGGVFGLALVVPPLLAALLYLLLLFRVPGVTAKYRIVLVAAGIGLWFGFSAARFGASLASDGTAGGEIISSLLGLLSAVLVLAAYLPPRPVRRWLGVESMPEQVRREERARSGPELRRWAAA